MGDLDCEAEKDSLISFQVENKKGRCRDIVNALKQNLRTCC